MTVSLESESFRKRINELDEELNNNKNSMSTQTTDETTQTEDSVTESVDELELSSVKVRKLSSLSLFLFISQVGN